MLNSFCSGFLWFKKYIRTEWTIIEVLLTKFKYSFWFVPLSCSSLDFIDRWNEYFTKNCFSHGQRDEWQEEERRQTPQHSEPFGIRLREGWRTSDPLLPHHRRRQIRRHLAAQQQGNQAEQGLPVHQRSQHLQTGDRRDLPGRLRCVHLRGLQRRGRELQQLHPQRRRARRAAQKPSVQNIPALRDSFGGRVGVLPGRCQNIIKYR